MNKIFIDDNFLSHDECNNIIEKCLSELILEKASIVNYDSSSKRRDIEIRKSSVSFTSNLNDVNDKLEKYLHSTIKYKGGTISRIKQFQFTKYDVDEYFDWHVDSSEKLYSNRIYSAVIVLNNTFTGGLLEIKSPDNEIITVGAEPGKLILFPSYYVHRVTNIKSGTRYSLVNWLEFKKDSVTKKSLI